MADPTPSVALQCRPWPPRAAWIVALLVLGVYAYFYNGAADNHNARLNSIWTFVEPGPHRWTLRMDPFMLAPARGMNTVDYARYGGHYYPNKAPGTQLLGVAVYLPLYLVERALGLDPTAAPVTYVNAYLINLGVTVVPVALSAVWFCLLALRLGGGRWRVALAATVTLYLGTMMFTHSTQLWGHTTVAACVVMILHHLSEATRRDWGLTGLWAGLAVVVEYQAMFIVLVLLAVALGHGLAGLRGGGRAAPWLAWRRALAPLAWVALGGLGPLAVFLLYHRLCFGSWWVIASHYQNAEFAEQGRFLGMFGRPTLAALWGLTCSSYRGLFYSAPVLLPAVAGFWYGWRQGHSRLLWWMAVGTAVVTLLGIAGFNGWHGGASFGPRYLIGCLPCLALGLVWLHDQRVWRVVWRALFAVSLLIMVAFASVSPGDVLEGPRERQPVLAVLAYFARQEFTPLRGMPIRNDWVPLYVEGRRFPPAVEPLVAFNLGNLLGLRGFASLLPLAAFVAGCGWWLSWTLRRVPDGPPAATTATGAP
jgi:hypothetical protein